MTFSQLDNVLNRLVLTYLLFINFYSGIARKKVAYQEKFVISII